MNLTLNSDESSSSGNNATDVNTEVAQDANNAPGSSTAANSENQKAEVTLSDVIRDAAPVIKPNDVSPDGKPVTADQGKAADPAKEKGNTSEEDKALPFHNHPRFQQLITENRAAKQQLESQKGDVAEMAEIKGFMDRTGLTAQEVAQGYQIMGLLKTDPIKAYQEITKIASNLSSLVGETLPEDLQLKVDNGDMTADAAKEVARSRFQTLHASTQLQRREQMTKEELERRNQESAREAFERLQVEMNGAVAQWEASTKTSDPDYAQKEEYITKEAERLSLSKPPKTTEDILNIVKQAYENTNQLFKKFAPARQPVRHTPSGASSANATTVPTSIKDIVAMGANGQLKQTP